MTVRGYLAGIVVTGIFSVMSYVVFQEQKDLVFSNRGGINGLDDWIGFLATGGFWLGCGALAWWGVIELIKKLFER
jgi:hypothetical protein